MDESSPFFQPKLPPKRKSINADASTQLTGGRRNPFTSKDQNGNADEENIFDSFAPDDVAIEQELIETYERLARDEQKEITVELDSITSKNEPTAPVLADCVDPHTVPLQYLLDQARASVKTDDDDDIPAELLEGQKEL